ncbi:hypothetical protein B0H66DRAFT_526825 [Apodospora peruviana]|uniref:HIG1 domain-containing protein n=1 Tax=Apodospora peruviana TaxID=516989 RepID=A0AAE0IQY5_9PEZI|nr:hypothetical protein B0H66DRAFT_526825 [Apodospora peruviana]
MKIISKEEEKAHYDEVLKGGFYGGTAGLAAGLTGVLAAQRRYPAFRTFSLPLRAFLVSSATTFGAIITAERFSVRFQRAKDPMNNYLDAAQRAALEAKKNESAAKRFMDWGRENRYTIVFSSWAASMGLALYLINRNKFLTTSQKLVQARVYAQGLALAMLIATAAFETADAKSGKGRWETVMVLDPDDPSHKHLIEKRVQKEDYEGQNLWQDMVAAEERRQEEQKRTRDSIAAASKAKQQ